MRSWLKTKPFYLNYTLKCSQNPRQGAAWGTQTKLTTNFKSIYKINIKIPTLKERYTKYKVQLHKTYFYLWYIKKYDKIFLKSFFSKLLSFSSVEIEKIWSTSKSDLTTKTTKQERLQELYVKHSEI